MKEAKDDTNVFVGGTLKPHNSKLVVPWPLRHTALHFTACHVCSQLPLAYAKHFVRISLSIRDI
jgi:hypothetical protein